MQTTTSSERGRPTDPGVRRSGVPEVSSSGVAAQPAPLRFHSILFPDPDAGEAPERPTPPTFFHDLNLDQIVEAVTAGREEYQLKPFFYAPLTSLDAIAYRHEIVRDLEGAKRFAGLKEFSTQMHAMRLRLAAFAKSTYPHQKSALFREAAEIYCGAVEALMRTLHTGDPQSRGLRSFRAYLADYVAGDRFQSLATTARRLKQQLSAIRYEVLINGSRVTVRHCDAPVDYSAVIAGIFEKFRRGAVTDHLAHASDAMGMNHVEAMVLERVALLNPATFRELDDYRLSQEDFLDGTIARFDREIQFYLAYLEHMERCRRTGLQFCHPRISATDKSVSSRNGFDLALADKLTRANAPVICNDFRLDGPERILIVTGPNQGGKTTFARMFGQLHYLASLGLPVPGTEARLFLFDQLFTHFEREEAIGNLRGKLEDDLIRMHQILEQASPNSIVVINEMFSSTALKDAVELSRRVMERLSQLDVLCACVTFLDELASLNAKTVSMVAGIVPENPTLRTFQIERRPADGLAYALALAQKHRVTCERLKERLKS